MTDDHDHRRLREAGFRFRGEVLPDQELWEHDSYPGRSFLGREEALAAIAELTEKEKNHE